MRWTRILAVAAVLLAAWWWFTRSHGPQQAAAPIRPPVLVQAVKAERRTVPFLIRAPGLVIASETVEVHSRIDSQVMEVHFKEGDMVKQGQLLFTLDDRALSADLRSRQAVRGTNEAEFQNAKRQFERARQLAAGGFQSTSELDKARADYESAEARIAATDADIERLKVMLGYTKITAAITGRAGAITATVGNTVKANDVAAPLVVINQVSPIRVQFGLPQQALDPLREQMSRGPVATTVIRDNVELPEKGHVEFVDNNINRTTATFESRAEFGNANEALWPGMIVELVMSLGEDTGVVAVPEISVQHGPSGDFVFIIDGNKASRRPVTVRRYGEGLAVITEGLQGSELVATDGMLSLSEGSPVELAGKRSADADAAAANGDGVQPETKAAAAPPGDGGNGAAAGKESASR